jgi:hypothetical protein
MNDNLTLSCMAWGLLLLGLGLVMMTLRRQERRRAQRRK